MSTERNKQVMRALFEEVWNDGRLDRLDDLVTPDSIGHDRSERDPTRGPEEARAFVRTYRDAFPDLRLTIEDEIAEGDRVALRWTAEGTHRGELMGIEPTGRTSVTRGVTIARFEDGRIAETWSLWDALRMLQDVGAIPEHRTAGRAGD